MTQAAQIRKLDDTALDVIFRQAHTANVWQDREVPDAVLRDIWDLMRWGPTSANCLPARIHFVKSSAAKEKLKPCLAKGNLDKTMAAPVTAIIATDRRFFEHMNTLYPQVDFKSGFEKDAKAAQETAFRNGSLMGGYFIIAARALGLDCGPMSGFNAQKLNEAFFPDGRYEANFLCNLGYPHPDPEKAYHPRNPRLDFATACQIL